MKRLDAFHDFQPAQAGQPHIRNHRVKFISLHEIQCLPAVGRCEASPSDPAPSSSTRKMIATGWGLLRQTKSCVLLLKRDGIAPMTSRVRQSVPRVIGSRDRARRVDRPGHRRDGQRSGSGDSTRHPARCSLSLARCGGAPGAPDCVRAGISVSAAALAEEQLLLLHRSAWIIRGG